MKLFVDGSINGTFYLYATLQPVIYLQCCDGLPQEWFLNRFASTMENVSKGSVVYQFLFILVGLLQIAHVAIEEAKLATQITTDGSRTDTASLSCKPVLERLYHLGRLFQFLRHA